MQNETDIVKQGPAIFTGPCGRMRGQVTVSRTWVAV